MLEFVWVFAPREGSVELRGWNKVEEVRVETLLWDIHRVSAKDDDQFV